MSMFRVFFFNLDTRKEMSDFEGNGKTWLGTSGMVRDADGNFIDDTCSFVEVADFADSHCVKGKRTITAKDFDFPVAVKVWFGPKNIEWRKLI